MKYDEEGWGGGENHPPFVVLAFHSKIFFVWHARYTEPSFTCAAVVTLESSNDASSVLVFHSILLATDLQVSICGFHLFQGI